MGGSAEVRRMTFTRRRILGAGVASGAALLLPPDIGLSRVLAQATSTLDPRTIPKHVTPLVIPPAMPHTGTLRGGIRYYEIAGRQFQQQILPNRFPATAVWSYGSVNHPGTFNYPAFTIEAAADDPVRVRWINDLVDENGDFLPHLLPVDPTVHWANPPGGVRERDSRPTFTSTPDRYRRPVPSVTHLHGGHGAGESDGFAEAWYVPRARNIPARFARSGTWCQPFRTKFQSLHHQASTPGNALFHYDNDQPAARLWYHDHTLDVTRLNVYAGPAGFDLIRGGDFDTEPVVLPGPAPALGGPPETRHYEVPLAIQDRSFHEDGSLFYPDSRAFFDEFEGPYIPDGDVPPIWNPEFFADTMVVNGNTWPVLEVEPRRYWFRILNGSNGRFLILKLVTGNPEARPAAAALQFHQIGAEGGFLPHPMSLDELLVDPAERADVVVDFTGLPEGTEVFMTGLKDTVIAYPGEITRVKAHFDRAGLIVWHCHLVEHEDNEMMRPYRIGS
jgi:spore coat protein A, manganese oxidase